MSTRPEGVANSVPHGQDQPSQDEAANGVNNEKNVQQVSDDHPTPEDHDHPRPTDGAPDGANEKQDGPPKRRSTFKDRFKEQKEKLKTKTKPPGGFDPTPIPDAPQVIP